MSVFLTLCLGLTLALSAAIWAEEADGRPGPVTYAEVIDDSLVVTLRYGREMTIPLSIYDELDEATLEERQDFSLVDNGRALHFHELNMEILTRELVGGFYRARSIGCRDSLWKNADTDYVESLAGEWGDEFFIPQCGRRKKSSFLHKAVRNSDLEVILDLYDRGLSLDQTDENGRDAIGLASRYRGG